MTNTQRFRAIQPNKITETVYYSPQEVAEMLHVSTKTVVRRFSEVPGVVDIGTPETRRRGCACCESQCRYSTASLPKGRWRHERERLQNEDFAEITEKARAQLFSAFRKSGNSSCGCLGRAA